MLTIWLRFCYTANSKCSRLKFLERSVVFYLFDSNMQQSKKLLGSAIWVYSKPKSVWYNRLDDWINEFTAYKTPRNKSSW